jgi:hypothetical protein
MYHLLDVADGQLARLTGKTTNWGKWVDGGGDKLVFSVWYIAISISLYIKNNNPLFLILGLVVMLGMYIYNYLLLTSVAYFRSFQFKFKSKSRLKNNPFSSTFLFFLNGDVYYHMITILAIIGRIDILLVFYAFYYNAVWLAYFIFYLIRYIMEGDVKET